ncbi:MAG TPA: hypothetical protein VEA38_07160 [Terriglobales bacterium]|nr:hypothetical protein [Terriglobales bacterium]
MKRLAYTVVVGGPGSTDEKPWVLAIAEENEPGYSPITGRYSSPYATQEEGRAIARELNARLGHDERTAMEIVLSSIGAQNRRGRRS